MPPNQLKPEHFAAYAPEARKLAVAHTALMQRLPLAFLPLLLREIIAYDFKFPVERKELDRQLALLNSQSPAQLQSWMEAFSKLTLSPDLVSLDWVNAPAQFSEQLTTHLWATHQIDAFRAAAVEYVNRLNASAAPENLPIPRLGIVVVGQGVSQTAHPLFRKLRPQGLQFTHVDPENGMGFLLEAVSARAASHPVPFGHWYVDGGESRQLSGDGVTCVSYASLEPVRASLLSTMDKAMQSGGGPEALRSKLAQMRPEDVGLNGSGDRTVLNHFQLSLLTEGSGTQIFSTTFVQWSARELLRRAQPLTLLTRYAPRRHEQSMKEMLAGNIQHPALDPAALDPAALDPAALDPEGSLVDADQGAYYTWINQQRLPHADRSAFLVWFEGHSQALAIGPSIPRGKVSDENVRLDRILKSVA